MKFLYKITDFAALPHVTLVAGVFLVFASAYDLRETLFSCSEGVQGEHATFLYGLVILLRSIGEMHEGLDEVHEGSDK